jgi:1-acyl-sn-glycerol-3-phosphate acyltransferase
MALPIKSNPLLSLLKTIAIMVWLLVCLVPILPLYWLGCYRLRMVLVHLFYKGMCFVTGMRITFYGEFADTRPLLTVSNHASYLDIFILGKLFPVAFTPKSEVRKWPLIGFLCVLADCVFVERRPSKMQQAQTQMRARLAAGKVLCIFPEGTTSNAREVMPFKSGFFSLTEQAPLPVQPICITYTHINDQPIDARFSDHVAWVGDATLFDHFWRLLGYRSISISVMLNPVFSPGEYENRKVQAAACEVVIRRQLQRNLRAIGVLDD